MAGRRRLRWVGLNVRDEFAISDESLVRDGKSDSPPSSVAFSTIQSPLAPLTEPPAMQSSQRTPLQGSSLTDSIAAVTRPRPLPLDVAAVMAHLATRPRPSHTSISSIGFILSTLVA